MTTTALNSALAVGGTPGVVGATKTSFQTASTAFFVSVLATMGNGLPDPHPRTLIVCYCSSPFSMTAAQAAVRLQPNRRVLKVPIGATGGAILGVDSPVETRSGDYLYAWIETEGFSNTIALDVSLQEL